MADTPLAAAIMERCHSVKPEYADWLPVWSKMQVTVDGVSFKYDQPGCTFYSEIGEGDLLELAGLVPGWDVFQAAAKIKKGLLFTNQQKDHFTYEQIQELWGWMPESNIPCIKRIINTNRNES